MPSQFDLIVIGSGPAASTVARKAAKDDRNVAIIESRGFGGTCALRGCNPKKVYTNAAALLDQVRRMNGKLASFEKAEIVWSQLHDFQREFTRPVEEKSESSFAEMGIATVNGSAKFTGPNEVSVGDQVFTANRIFVATGARPATLTFEGAEHAIDSAEFLNLKELPNDICFIGGGYISMEFGHVAAQFGSRVSVIQSGTQVLKGFDPDIVKQLTDWSQNQDMDIQLNARVTGITEHGDKLKLTFEQDGAEREIETTLVVHGAGRVPNIEGLNLETANVEFGKSGIKVNDHMQSVSNPVIFAAGDVADNQQPMLTPTANEEARIVAKNLFTDLPEQKPDYGKIARVAFTTPPIAAVGMSESEARGVCSDLEVRCEDTSEWSSVKKQWQTCAGFKLLIDGSSDKVLGAHLLGPCADETINLFTLAMKFNLTATDIKSTLFAYPTFADSVRRMV